MPSFILIHPTIWPQYTNDTDKTDRQDSQQSDSIGRTVWATVCKTVRPMLSDCCPVRLSVTLVYCGQTVGWIKMKLGMQVGLDTGDIVLDGDPALPKGAQPPNCWPMSVVAKWLDGLRRHLVWR